VKSELVQGAWLVSPLFAGFILHGVSIRYGFLTTLARPIDRGTRVRNRRLFGDNKTYRAGAWVVLAICVSVTPGLVLGSVLFMYLGHQVITGMGYLLGMRTTAR
jgi:hypothetical protein